MSKLYELLIAAAGTHQPPHNLPFCEITVFKNGEIFVHVSGNKVAGGKDEAELIADLSRYLQNEKVISAE